jgi:hypothetical protein
MNRHFATALALTLALASLFPGLAALKLAANHNQTLLRG